MAGVPAGRRGRAIGRGVPPRTEREQPAEHEQPDGRTARCGCEGACGRVPGVGERRDGTDRGEGHEATGAERETAPGPYTRRRTQQRRDEQDTDQQHRFVGGPQQRDRRALHGAGHAVDDGTAHPEDQRRHFGHGAGKELGGADRGQPVKRRPSADFAGRRFRFVRVRVRAGLGDVVVPGVGRLERHAVTLPARAAAGPATVLADI